MSVWRSIQSDCSDCEGTIRNHHRITDRNLRLRLLFSLLVILVIVNISFYIGYRIGACETESKNFNQNEVPLLPQHSKRTKLTGRLNVHSVSSEDNKESEAENIKESKKEIFDRSVAKRLTQFLPSDLSGPLAEYGLQRRYSRPKSWLGNVSTSDSYDPSLHISSLTTRSDGSVGFKHTDSLLDHIHRSVREHQRFLTEAHRDLHHLIAELPISVEKHELMKRNVVLTSTHSTEFSRLIRGEIEEFMMRTKHTERSQQTLNFLKAKIQTEIRKRQSYPCDRAVRYIFKDNNGFAAGLRSVVRYMIEVFLKDQRFIMDSSQWHYLGLNFTWNKIFESFPSITDDDCPESPVIEGKSTDPPLLFEVPVDIANDLVRHHDDPYVWWFGQFVGYLLQPSEFTKKAIEDVKVSMDFKAPIVGLHIRRTDKSIEASYHPVEEYMSHVEDFYLGYGTDIRKRVFVATDEPKVIQELMDKFPEYEFLANRKAAEFANDMNRRYSIEATQTLIIDLFLLSEVDKIVCTFSSGFCRLAFELMQVRRVDARGAAVSLDVAYQYMLKFPNPPRVALHRHEPLGNNELFLSPGDSVCRKSGPFIITEAKEKAKYDGFSIGHFCGASKVTGKYPTFKTVPSVCLANVTRLL